MTAGAGTAFADEADADADGTAAAGVIDLVHTPLRGVEARGGMRWDALDEDPQFLLALPEARGPGACRIGIRMHGVAVHAPCLYLDMAGAWSEHARIALEEAPGGGLWSALIHCPEGTVRFRLDPGDRAGELTLAGATLRPVSVCEQLVALLDATVAQAPECAAGWLHGARLTLEAGGLANALARLRGGSLPADASVDDAGYRRWAARFDTIDPASRTAIADAVTALSWRPLLSLVLPVPEGPVIGLEALVETLLAQDYPDWELLLVHAAAPGSAALEALDACAARASRIRLLATDGTVGERIASGLQAASGAFAAVVVPELRLAPHALLVLVEALRRSDARIAYSDHDHLDVAGRRIDPRFKPDWDPDLLLAEDFPGPFVLYARGLLRGDPDPGDPLRARALRISTQVAPDDVVHVPCVLYHLAVPFASRPGTELAAAEAEVVAAHLARVDPGASVVRADGCLRVRRLLPAPPPKVSIVIPTRDRLDLLARCVDGILAQTTYPRFEVVVVDNQSVQPDTHVYLEALRAGGRARVLAYDQPFNYSAINNHAVSQVDGDVVVLLNNDVELISPDWLEEMLQYALRPDVGAVGAMLYYPDDTIQHAGVVLGLGGVAGHAHAGEPRGSRGRNGRARAVQAMGAVTGACLMVRREAYLRVGGLDETLAVAFNDIDFCLRLADLGLRTVMTPFAEFYHHESASRGSEDTPVKQARFASEVLAMHERWGARLSFDPGYNPNLSLASGRAHLLADAPRAPLSGWIADVVADADASATARGGASSHSATQARPHPGQAQEHPHA